MLQMTIGFFEVFPSINGKVYSKRKYVMMKHRAGALLFAYKSHVVEKNPADNSRGLYCILLFLLKKGSLNIG